MTPAQTKLVDAARRIGGERAVSTDPADIMPWLTDWRGRYHGRTPAILSPGSVHESAAIVAEASRLGVPLTPQGGNTSMVGGATPPADGSALILSARRLRTIRAVDAAAGRAVAEAGVILADLHVGAAARRMRFPLTLGARGSATIGGLVSTNAGGTQVLRFGTMRRLVTGVEAVLPDGSIHDGLSPLRKDTRGYDPNQLLVGAEGTLGFITAASLMLVPAIAARAVGWIGVASPAAALALLRAMEARTDTIESFEILPGASLDAVLRHIPGTRPPLAQRQAWHVLVEVASGEGDAPLADLLETLIGAAIGDGLAMDAVIAASEAQADAFWRIRDSLSEAERADGPASQHDISVPVEAMPRFMVEAAAAIEAAFPGTRASGFGHLGDGNVHFHVRSPAGMSAEAWHAGAASAATRMVHDLVVAAGGSIAAEHGIGQMKLGELERLGPPARLSMLRAIKSAIDPKGLFNPGKLVKVAPDRPAT